ncbi:phenylalanine--tRNA ligase subunit beta, partial [Patescibacteria group bacterium]|nr:phenylalanine--tRNA ligase subunit beta [Patescibacteria group bacterium]
EKIDDLLDAQVKDMAGCLRYSARVVDGVKVGESPMWLKRRLVMAGMRPINSVVDITNYVMLEYGQPMHAFDYDSIIGHKLVIRRAKKGERIMTLDDQKKVLSARDLIIADEKRPLALAGIIGGADSGVLPNTRRIVLESANFARKLINESSRTLGVQTDSSIRFGKGLPMALTTQALDRAAYLISQICGGQVAQGMIDVRSQRLLKKDQKLRYENIDSFLGIDVPKNDVKKILKSLDFEIKKPGDDDLTVGISPLRVDIENEDDLIEEVGRIYGYNKIEPEVFEMPVVVPGPEGVRRYRNRILNYLCDRGYSEVYSYCFVSTKDLSGWGFDVEDSYELLNPVDKNLQFLRQSLISGMVEKYKKWKKYDEQVKLFEWGQVFGKKLKNKEKTHLSMIFSDKEDGKDLFLQVKGVIEGMLRLGNVGWNDFDLKRAKEVDCDIDILHPVNSVVLIKDKGIIGSFGLIHPMKLSESKIPGKVVFAEFDLEKLVNSFVETVEYKEPSKFPVSKYDISLFVDNNVMSGEMIVVAKDVGGKTLKDVVVFDEISGEKLLITKDKLLEGREAEDLKSVGLRFGWQSDSETLSDELVEKNMQKVIGKLKEEFGVVLRDG